MAEQNDAGFRQFGRPDTIKSQPQDTALLQKAELVRQYANWLRMDCWGLDKEGRLRRIGGIRSVLDEMEKM